VSGVDWRSLAREILPLLRDVLGSEAEAAAAEAEIRAALGEDEPAATIALRRALTRRSAIREWVRRRAAVISDERYRLWPADRPAHGSGEAGTADASQVRHLLADLPEQAPVGRTFPLLVRVAVAAPDGSGAVALRPLTVGAHGTAVTISVMPSTGLRATGDLEQELLVPADGDSDPIRFGFVADRTGLHTVVVRAFLGGSFLGEVTTQVSARAGASFHEGRTAARAIVASGATAGEATLQIFEYDGRYLFQLLGDSFSTVEPLERIAETPSDTVRGLHRELKDMAEGRPGLSTGDLVRRRLAGHGAALWANAVPAAIRRRFWEQLDRITSLTIACDTDLVPWELMYAVDGADELGFLAQELTVTRRVTDQRRAAELAVTDATYVIPPDSPTDAEAEIAAVRDLLGTAVRDRGTLASMTELLAQLDADPPTLLHLACHNVFTAGTGSEVAMTDGRFRPVDLELLARRETLARTASLVFFNACDSAGEARYLSGTMSWARQFMTAGAGAFVGTLWPVRSTSATTFAEVFYRSLATDGQSLGTATRTARSAIAAGHDPSFLAYTVYGNPAATTGRRPL
jgi:hypothetical protein